MKEIILEMSEEQVNELLECDCLNIGGTRFYKDSVLQQAMADNLELLFTDKED